MQIGALSGVSQSAAGLASGRVEAMREIGGAAGVAAVSTVLVTRSGLDGFHPAFAVVGALAAIGVVTAAAGFAGSPREAATCEPTYERDAADQKPTRRAIAGPKQPDNQRRKS